MRSPAEGFSLLYLNPPYDFETGQTKNQRLELVFLEHTHLVLTASGIMIRRGQLRRLEPQVGATGLFQGLPEPGIQFRLKVRHRDILRRTNRVAIGARYRACHRS